MITALARFGNYRKKEEKEEKFSHPLRSPQVKIAAARNCKFWFLDFRLIYFG